MRKYEVMYILKPNLESEKVKEQINKFNDIFTSKNSNILELKEWGLRDLAYEIDHFRKGYYVWLLVEATNEAVFEFNRRIRINENVIRFILVKEGE